MKRDYFNKYNSQKYNYNNRRNYFKYRDVYNTVSDNDKVNNHRYNTKKTNVNYKFDPQPDNYYKKYRYESSRKHQQKRSEHRRSLEDEKRRKTYSQHSQNQHVAAIIFQSTLLPQSLSTTINFKNKTK